MTKTVHAIYEKGILKPLDTIEGITENTEVELTISVVKRAPHPVMRFAGILSPEDADRMIKTVEDEFEKVNPDEWKD